ncbi:asparagine synthetase B family protein [Nonomuraea phyllanthi]|uniref:Asparagine synthetase B family protein n=1 Tax=Nonomuraea phyllanthi TaxID=2219224 RepID=A0A5C4WVL4_9ACTN|nr:asparagine synthetase B family protein [Nonomuraea phyllanthi]KAB8197282.1 asparagine synthetase B family protein [Nonomuraea phyllanthi]QFY06723.1 asparagine synthetase B family protein [Nonomuraea phyllanthi]
MQFNVRPYVCGALGRIDTAILGKLTAAGPRVLPALQSPEAALFSSTPLPPYHRAGNTFAFSWGERKPSSADDRAADWMAVAETYETPGLIGDGESVTLHTGALGLVDVYFVRHGDAVYFSSLIQPLLSLAPIEIDWSAWASILQVTFPLGEATPYTGVKRLPGSSALVWRYGRLATERRLPRWLRTEPYESWISPGEIVELLGEVYAGYEGRKLLVPVSGGYDSRLLAGVAVARGMDVESWTTSPDDGTDTDIAFARAITRELDIPHRVITQDAAAYPGDAAEVARRLEYLTPHHAWYAPFAKEVHGAGRILVDGLAGGPLLKNFMVSGAALEARTQAERSAAVLSSLSLGAPSQPFLSKAAAQWMEETVREQFAAATSMFHGHRAELPLSVLHTRTVRGIARSVVNLVGPEASFAAPFIDPRFFDAALSVGVARKHQGRFYREVLHAANPRVAALPSTNVVKQPLRRVPLRSTAAPARNYSHRMLETVVRRVPTLLSDEMHEVIAGGPDALTRYNGWNDRFWVRGLVLFGLWLSDFENDLSDLAPPF